tara:strand:- start:1084 stop:1245 length:162 start_codon:yes stop_codon:yes gene_type:complete
VDGACYRAVDDDFIGHDILLLKQPGLKELIALSYIGDFSFECMIKNPATIVNV